MAKIIFSQMSEEREKSLPKERDGKKVVDLLLDAESCFSGPAQVAVFRERERERDAYGASREEKWVR